MIGKRHASMETHCKAWKRDRDDHDRCTAQEGAGGWVVKCLCNAYRRLRERSPAKSRLKTALWWVPSKYG